MNTHVKVGGKYLFVSIHISGNSMRLRNGRGVRKPLIRHIHLDEIENLYTVQLYGGKQISFTHNDEQYTIYETGLGVVGYLETNLCAKVRNEW